MKDEFLSWKHEILHITFTTIHKNNLKCLPCKLILVKFYPAHSFNPYAYFGHSWSYFDIQILLLVILYIIYSTRLIFDDILHRKFDKYRITANIIVNCFITLKWKVKVKPSQYEINHFIMTSYIMQWKVKVNSSQCEF
jgi:hypothetical protein